MKARKNIACSLTERQKEVVSLMADGKIRDEIAEILGISTNTVNNYVKTAMDVTGTANACGLVGFAFRKGWLM